MSSRTRVRRLWTVFEALAWRRHLAFGFISLLLAPWIALGVTAAFSELPTELEAKIPEQSLRVEDRNGNLLREVRAADGALSRWVPLEQVPAFFVDAVIAVEDQRFHAHPGVDPLAVLRAAAQWAWHGGVVSGASTLSMQLSRNLRPHPRTVFGKFTEMALALRIEASLSKAEILEQWLNRVDFGPNLRGIGAASQSYFGRTPSQLSDAELALLAGLPQSPTAYALHSSPERAQKRRATVLKRLRDAGSLTAEEVDSIERWPITPVARRSAFGAPHFVTSLTLGRFDRLQPQLRASIDRGASRIRTTIDPELQRVAETAITRALYRLRANDVSAASVVLLDHQRGEILAYVGSPDFYSNESQGQVDGVHALRQPGSTLKPFVYASAFVELGYDAATALPDVELRLDTPQGAYTPRNYDDRFRGPVRLRDALANSLNVPAVRTAVALGPDTLLRHLHALGFDSLDQGADHYGPALALGDGEVTLLELVNAYATLARGGRQSALRAVLEVESSEGSVVLPKLDAEAETRVLPEATAAVITDILKDPVARAQTFGRGSSLEFEFDVAVKTGTSKGYRDNWVVGFTDRFTLGVWVGNFDGRPMLEVSGATGAAPIFAAILRALAVRHRPGRLPVDASLSRVGRGPEHWGLVRAEVCPLSGLLRGPACPQGVSEWLPRVTERSHCDWHRHALLDRRNGLLAGPDCAGSSVVERPVELLPPEYTQWAHTVGRPSSPSGSSPHCPLPESADRAASMLQISSPADGSRFVIDPDRPRALQRLQVAVAARGSLARPRLQIDGGEPLELDASLRYDWRLEPGVHVFVAIGERGEQSEPVRITVREPI